MRYEIKNKIYEDENLLRFLREDSSWYKYLNRNMPIEHMIEEMKVRYSLRFKDKVNKFGTGVSLIRAFMDATKE